MAKEKKGKAYWSRGWGTQEELLYISKIGESKKNSKEGVQTTYEKLNAKERREWKIKYLKLYLQAAKNRVFWGAINAKDAVQFANKELQKFYSTAPLLR